MYRERYDRVTDVKSLSVVPPMGQSQLTPMGERMEQRRGELGLTQRQVTDELGVGQQQWWRWSTGQAVIKGESLVKLARALDTSAEWLWDGTVSIGRAPVPPELSDFLATADGGNLPQDVKQALESLQLPEAFTPELWFYRTLATMLEQLRA